MFSLLKLLLGTFLRLFRSRRRLVMENLVLRQPLAVLKPRRKRPKLRACDKLFWVRVRRLWSGWKSSLLLVAPETVVRWHNPDFRLCYPEEGVVYLAARRSPVNCVAFCISMLPPTQLHTGRDSKCERPFPSLSFPATCCATAMPFSAMISENSCEIWASARSCRHRARRGSEPMSSE